MEGGNLPPTPEPDRYADMMARLSRHTLAFALGIWALSIAARWGEWRVMALGAALWVLDAPFNVYIDKRLIQRHGALVGELVRVAGNLILIGMYAVVADWPLPVWMWLPFLGLVTDPVERRVVRLVVFIFCVSMGALALVCG